LPPPQVFLVNSFWDFVGLSAM